MAGKNYQWNAADYAQHSSQQFKWACELTEKLHLHGDETVLDIGCGDGKVTAAIAARLPKGRGRRLGRSKIADDPAKWGGARRGAWTPIELLVEGVERLDSRIREMILAV